MDDTTLASEKTNGKAASKRRSQADPTIKPGITQQRIRQETDHYREDDNRQHNVLAQDLVQKQERCRERVGQKIHRICASGCRF